MNRSFWLLLGEMLTKGRLVVFLIAALLSACGGGGSPVGSVVNYPGGGPSSPPTQLVNVKVTVTIPASKSSKYRIRVHPQYVSVNTQSLVIQLASVNGSGVTGVNPTTINTDARAKGCSDVGGTRTCSGTATGSPGSDVFSVTTFSAANGTGSLLSAGTVQARISGNDGGVRITNTLPLTLRGIVASMQLSVSPSSAKRGKATKAAVTLQAFDASGAQIVGPSDYADSISLQIQGDVQNAFLLHAGGKSASSLTIVKPTSNIAMSYDGNAQAAPVTIAATVDGSAVAANANFALKGRVPPPPVGTIYALNYGSSGSGQSATVTEYGGSAKGNAAPERTLKLSSKLYARSLAVDSSGDIYVGYFDTPSGASASNGSPDTGNEIAIYSPDASGSASPNAVIAADKSSQTAVFPIFMSFDSSGDLVTYGATSVDGNAGNDAVLIYSSPSSGPSVPSNAWAFSSPGLRYPGPTGLALDGSGNFYVNGALHLALGPSYGLFVAPSSDDADPSVTPSRTLPWDTKTKLTPGATTNVAVSSSGEIFIAASLVTFSGSNPICQGAVNVYSAGYGGGTTDVPPLRTLTLGGILTKNYECDSPRNPLVAFFPSITLYGTTLFAVDDFNNAIDAYKSSGNKTVQPTLQITGAATGLNAPTAIVVSSLSGQAKAGPVFTH
jgi:hypothetical protein